MRAYLRLTRAHTTPLEAVPAAVGALLVTEGEITLGVLLWTLYGVGYHLTGYGMNSYSDWKNGYDQEDPHKQHHPLNSGALGRGEAKWMIVGTGICTALLGFVLSVGTAALLVIVIGVVAGVLYNEVGKETLLKPALISVAHSTVFLAPYVALGGGNRLIAVGGTLMVFVWVFYQIAVSGEIKDMDSNEANILKDVFGCRHSSIDGIAYNRITDEAKLFAVTVRVSAVLLFTMLTYLISGELYSIVTLVVGGATVARSSQMMKEANRDHSRGRLIELMSQIEIMTLLMFLLVFVVPLGGVAFGIFVLSGLWVVSLNKSLWGTYIAPRV